MRGSKLTRELFIEQANLVHQNRYDYSCVKYQGANTEIEIICAKHGLFLQQPSVHVSKRSGCPVCAIEKMKTHKQGNVDLFVRRAQEKHGKVYDYSKVSYVNNYTKVEIVCNKHGSFFQKPCEHTAVGRGCPICSHKKKGSRTGRIPRKNVNVSLYLLQFYDDKETFLKIGITEKKLTERFVPARISKYKFKPISVSTMNGRQAFVVEQQLLNNPSLHRYVPTRKFCGSTECFEFSNTNIKQIRMGMETNKCQD